ncbi:MAG: hypothetical protein Q4A50_10185 [Bacteroidales bacterium]|nr:hypothetical protein [Bacteroidales bacterium]
MKVQNVRNWFVVGFFGGVKAVGDGVEWVFLWVFAGGGGGGKVGVVAVLYLAVVWCKGLWMSIVDVGEETKAEYKSGVFRGERWVVRA